MFLVQAKKIASKMARKMASGGLVDSDEEEVETETGPRAMDGDDEDPDEDDEEQEEDDDEEEDDEDEDDEDGGGGRKRGRGSSGSKKRSRMKTGGAAGFFLDEAEQDDEEEQDGYTGRREAEDEDFERIKALQDRRREQEGEHLFSDPAATIEGIAEKIRERHRQRIVTGPTQSGLVNAVEGRDSEVHRGAVAPTITDRLWVVPCITGKEKDAVLALTKKLQYLSKRGKASSVQSIMETGLKGKIYIECPDETDVKNLITGRPYDHIILCLLNLTHSYITVLTCLSPRLSPCLYILLVSDNRSANPAAL